ncbi:MAG: glycosyltransferase family 2 protein [Candidatus Omnitrophica bacterium]|nr:glycosyltransferase family 2 protein [Candidatus Omnitrophota bacterium]MBU1925749.1 glycosyltransferase family 2 protein [Candidatus Omnitrophota bacterium]
MRINIIIPVYNEQELVNDTLKAVISQLTLDYQIIIVDDCSTDNTLKIVNSFAQTHTNIVVITNTTHQGFAGVLKQGIVLVPEDEVFIPVMADGCDDVGLIEEMYRHICRGADVVCASRYIKGGRRIGGALLKSIGSRFVNWIFAIGTKIPCHDSTNSFKMMRKKACDSFTLESAGFEISAELILKVFVNKYKIVELPTVWRERRKGQSHFRLYKDGKRYIKWLFYGFNYRN